MVILLLILCSVWGCGLGDFFFGGAYHQSTHLHVALTLCFWGHMQHAHAHCHVVAGRGLLSGVPGPCSKTNQTKPVPRRSPVSSATKNGQQLLAQRTASSCLAQRAVSSCCSEPIHLPQLDQTLLVSSSWSELEPCWSDLTLPVTREMPPRSVVLLARAAVRMK